MTVNTKDNNMKESDNKDIKDSVLLYSAGVIPAVMPGLQLTAPNTIEEKTASQPGSSMEMLKTSFEEWRSVKEEHSHLENKIPMDVFEGSLYQVFDSLDQDVFQPTDGTSISSTTTLTSSPPASLSDRISVLLKRIKALSTGKYTASYIFLVAFNNDNHYLTPVFREQVGYWKNAVSVWLFDSLLSPTWQEFLMHVEGALSASVSRLQSTIFGVNNEPIIDTSSNIPNPQVPSTSKKEITQTSQKSRFEYVPPSSGAPSQRSVVNYSSNSTALPRETPSVSHFFKDFAQPQVTNSTTSINSLSISDQSKTTEFFDRANEGAEKTSLPMPTKSPGYTAPSVCGVTDPDWYLKWTKNNMSTSSLASTRSSGVEAIEAISDFIKSDFSTKKVTEMESQPRSGTTTVTSKDKDIASSLGFETIEY